MWHPITSKGERAWLKWWQLKTRWNENTNLQLLLRISLLSLRSLSLKAFMVRLIVHTKHDTICLNNAKRELVYLSAIYQVVNTVRFCILKFFFFPIHLWGKATHIYTIWLTFDFCKEQWTPQQQTMISKDESNYKNYTLSFNSASSAASSIYWMDMCPQTDFFDLQMSWHFECFTCQHR